MKSQEKRRKRNNDKQKKKVKEKRNKWKKYWKHLKKLLTRKMRCIKTVEDLKSHKWWSMRWIWLKLTNKLDNK